MLERIMEEIKRRTLAVRIFPNAAGCLRLVRVLAVEMHENWIEAIRYLKGDLKRQPLPLRPIPGFGLSKARNFQNLTSTTSRMLYHVRCEGFSR
jgi:hypothetical protein